MTDYAIRKITEEDVPFLWEMLYASIFTPIGEELPSKDIIHHPSISKYLEGWGRQGDVGFIAIGQSGHSLGSITIRFFTKENKGYGYVNDATPELGMAVLSEFRGMGIGSKLLRNLIDEVKLNGIKTLSLSVDPNNPAVNLYKRFGFKEIGMEGTSIIMMANL